MGAVTTELSQSTLWMRQHYAKFGDGDRDRKHTWFENNREQAYTASHITMRRLIDRAFEVLGGYRCASCGFNDARALQIDHLDGGGARERKALSPWPFYKRVIEVGRTSYQVLCANCNSIKRIERKESHKRRTGQ